MSGPATATFAFGPGLALAVLALREARQMGREYQEVAQEMQDRAADLAQSQSQLRTARFYQLQATRQQTDRLTTQLARLGQIAAELNLAAPPMARPTAGPEPKTLAAWQAHAVHLQESVVALQSAIAAAQPGHAAAASSLAAADLPPIEEALHMYMARRALTAHLPADEAQAMQKRATRLLERLHLEDGDPIPADLDALGLALILAPNLERAETLSAELRLQIQRHNDSAAQQRADAAEAQNYLTKLEDALPVDLRDLLEGVLMGAPMLPETRALAVQIQDAQQVSHQLLEEQAAAHVLEASLRDLGYEVDGVQDTLFVEGGVAHFQRHGWGEYFVRMRVGLHDKTVNFNVVRARGAEESAERKRLDYLAEDRWCSEFPKLLETLAARGLQLKVQRLLGAGELPVQAVDPASVPVSAAETRHKDARQLREMKP